MRIQPGADTRLVSLIFFFGKKKIESERIRQRKLIKKAVMTEIRVWCDKIPACGIMIESTHTHTRMSVTKLIQSCIQQD